jgi:signal peptidase I
MRGTLKFLCALAVAFLVMLAFRALAFTIYTVPGSQFEPTFKAGDCVIVNRWSYGLRTGGSGLFGYDRWCRQQVEKADWVAVNDSMGRILIGQCKAQPSDTVSWQRRTFILPAKANCAHHDYYLIEPVGVVREEQIIGRIMCVVYNHQSGSAIWKGYDASRLLLLPSE